MTIDEIKRSGIYSPGIWEGQVMNFLLAGGNSYFLKRQDESAYQKDPKGGYLKVPLQQVLKAREAYLNDHFEQEKESAINSELEKLGRALIDKAEKIIKLIDDHASWQKGQSTFGKIMEQVNPVIMSQKKHFAEMFFRENPNAIEQAETLRGLVERKDYEGLHQVLSEEGEPLASFKHGSLAMKNMFSAGSVAETITELQEKGAFYMKAKINIEKRYFP